VRVGVLHDALQTLHLDPYRLVRELLAQIKKTLELPQEKHYSLIWVDPRRGINLRLEPDLPLMDYPIAATVYSSFCPPSSHS
jgi:hypothetical protein